MPQVVFSQQAIKDIRRCYLFLSEKDTTAAVAAIRTIRQALHILRQHPEAGRPVKDRPAVFREWFIKYGESGYVALYRFDGCNVMILAIKHQKELGYRL